MKNEIRQLIRARAAEFLSSEIQEITQLPPSGSNRIYYRITTAENSLIAAYNPNKRENEAFVHLNRVIRAKDLPVPEVLAYYEKDHIYFLTDLGNDILFDRLISEKGNLTHETKEHLKSAMRTLCSFQTDTPDEINFSKCYPREAFDRQSIQWDLNYFKYDFLNLSYIPYDEEKLEKDFQRLMDEIEKVPANYFMYRDFQSRNIMIHDKRNYFIDFQGGRKGPMQYDVASFLFQVKADFSWELRSELLQTYLQELKKKKAVSKDDFMSRFPLFIYLRLLQVLGAYGYRGMFEKKPHFLTSIAFAAKLLQELPEHYPLPFDLPELQGVFRAITAKFKYEDTVRQEQLKVHISSFSYLKGGIPVDLSGNGGGHVFDCRALPNPGRIESMKDFTGRDKIIIDYLKSRKEVDEFLENVFKIVDQSVSNYRERKFKNLMVSFGCTGGQHRSVYCARKLEEHLRNYHGIVIEVKHQEL